VYQKLLKSVNVFRVIPHNLTCMAVFNALEEGDPIGISKKILKFNSWKKLAWLGYHNGEQNMMIC